MQRHHSADQLISLQKHHLWDHWMRFCFLEFQCLVFSDISHIEHSGCFHITPIFLRTESSTLCLAPFLSPLSGTCSCPPPRCCSGSRKGFKCFIMRLHFTNFRWVFDIQIIIIMVNGWLWWNTEANQLAFCLLICYWSALKTILNDFSLLCPYWVLLGFSPPTSVSAGFQIIT